MNKVISPISNNKLNLLCIDPGTTHSGIIIIQKDKIETANSKMWNQDVMELIYTQKQSFDHMVIEMIASYGMAVGVSVFETIVWIGRMIEAFGENQTTKIYRKQVKLHLCNSVRAKDNNVRQAILDLFPSTGGGKTPQIGTKNNPGQLYGVTSHAFSALAVGLTYLNTK